MNGALRLAVVLARRSRVMLLVWILGIVALVAVTIPSYAATYPSLASRAPLVAQLQATPATKVLYGVLPSPGTLGQLAVWETGTYVTLLVAVLGVLLGVRLGRGEEWSGHREIVRSVGAGRLAPVVGALAVLTATFVAIGGGVGGVLAWQSRSIPEVSVTGAWHFGAVVLLLGLGFGVSTMVLGEVLPSPTAARTAGWALLGLDFVLRVVADFAPAPTVRWATWLGLRDLVAPFTHNRTTPLVVAVVAVGLFAGVTVALDVRRDLGAGLVPARAGTTRALRVGGPFSLGWRLGRTGWLGWAGATVALAALFGGMSHGLVTLLRSDSSSSDMLSSLTGVGDPVRQYFTFSVVFVALVPLLHAVSHTLLAVSDERTGLLDVQLATGVERWAPLVARAGLGAARAVALILCAATVQAGAAAAAGAGRAAAGWAFWTVIAATPGVLAAVGLTALLVGVTPRAAALAWLLVAWSLFAALLGKLVRLPDWARSTSLLTPDRLALPLDRAVHWAAIVVLVAIAVGGTWVGLTGMARRDIVVTRPGSG